MNATAPPGSNHTAQDLAKAPGFALGPLDVDPPSRRVSAGGREAMLEPRVMRVLVALGAAEGAVLSRDDLIVQCWDGTIVGDNAINRAIAQLRHVLDDLGGGAVRLETITKVGFRLVCGESAPGLARPGDSATPPRTSGMTRRAAVAGGVLVLGAGAALGYAAWRRPAWHVPDPRAVDFLRRSQQAMQAGDPDSLFQAVSFAKQAVAIDPDFADAWGLLAHAYSVGKPGLTPESRAPPSLSLVRSAAERALALDPDQPLAQIALIVVYPAFGRWLDHEPRLRAIVRRHPNHEMGHLRLAFLLEDAGRFEEAIVHLRRTLAIDPMAPYNRGHLALDLHYAGHDHEAEAALDEAFSLQPVHFPNWLVRFAILVGSKRYDEAAAFARDSRYLPGIALPQFQELRIQIAEALATSDGIDRAASRLRDAVADDIEQASTAAALFAELGAASAAFAALEAYYFGGELDGRSIAPPNPFARRRTDCLYAPAILALRDDPRFGALLARTGLEDYWRKSGSRPDFRRG